MASQEVLTALDALYRELEKLQPATKLVEAAEEVTQTVKAIPLKHMQLLSEIEDSNAKLKGELRTAITEILHQVQTEQESVTKLRDSVQAYYERITEINFPDRLSAIENAVKKQQTFTYVTWLLVLAVVVVVVFVR